MSISQAVTVLEVEAGVLSILSKNYPQYSSVSLCDFNVIGTSLAPKAVRWFPRKILELRSEDSEV